MKFLYNTALGRWVLKALFASGLLKLAAKLCHTPLSKPFIKSYIKKHGIDMTDFEGQNYKSFAGFFSRTRSPKPFEANPRALISPCDGLVSARYLEDIRFLHIKDSWYSVDDLIPDKELAAFFKDGLCLIFRLRASDYHHFCYVDHCYHRETHFVPGKLHSVQPIACEKEPVFRLNRRMWSVLDTENFGRVVQIEVGAVLVGGMVHEKEQGPAKKGEEMGRFELVGSTILLFLEKNVREKLQFVDSNGNKLDLTEERPVNMGQMIGLVHETAE